MLPGGDSGQKEAAPDASRTPWNAPWRPPMRASRRSSRIPCPGLRGEESAPAGTAPLRHPERYVARHRVKAGCGQDRLAGLPAPQTSYSLVSWRGYVVLAAPPICKEATGRCTRATAANALAPPFSRNYTTLTQARV